MSKLFNYRFYRIIGNTIKESQFDSNLFKTKVVANIGYFTRFINTTDKSGKTPKNKIKSNEKHLISHQINDNPKKRNNTSVISIDTKTDLIESLDINETAFSLTVTEMKKFLQNRKLKTTIGRTCLSIDCPFCQSRAKPLNSMNESIDSKLFINKKTSNFICFSCETSGNWISFIELITNLRSRKSNKSEKPLPEVNNDLFGDQNTVKELNQIMENSLTIDELSEEELNFVRNKFELNCFTKESLKYFGICFSKDLKQLLIPYKSCFDRNKINAIKVIELSEDIKGSENTNKFIDKLVPNDPKLAVFGLNQHFLNDCSFDELVITDSPLDAMAVTQQTSIPSVSVPSNSLSKNLRPEVLPFFEKFKKITIWFSSSTKDLGSAKIFSRKLDEKRCYFVGSRGMSEHLTPLEALKCKSKLNKYLDSSQQISSPLITTFNSLRQAILSEIKDPLCAGVQWKRYPEMNQLLKGHRSGELTVFTGPTGCGKTTFMSEYSLDLCSQGVRTLWGSFEVKNVRLAKMMLTQFAEKPIAKHLNEFDLWADKLEELPLYFMTFHGQESIDKVLSAMSHAVYVHDIKHVIVDNIQFMLGSIQKNINNRFWHQDLVLDRFRKFATKEDCHVSLVMHPRKEDDMNELNNNSIFGGAKAAQEADNVMILQNKFLSSYRCQKYIEITKNRWDGDLGKVPLYFDKESLSYSPQNRRSDHLINSNDSCNQLTDELKDNLEFVRIKCKSEEEFDDFRLQ